jgi:hypothetical protein
MQASRNRCHPRGCRPNSDRSPPVSHSSKWDAQFVSAGRLAAGQDEHWRPARATPCFVLGSPGRDDTGLRRIRLIRDQLGETRASPRRLAPCSSVVARGAWRVRRPLALEPRGIPRRGHGAAEGPGRARLSDRSHSSAEEKTDYYGRRAQIEHPTRTAVHIREEVIACGLA